MVAGRSTSRVTPWIVRAPWSVAAAPPLLGETLLARASVKRIDGYFSTSIDERRSRSRCSLPVTRVATGASTQPRASGRSPVTAPMMVVVEPTKSPTVACAEKLSVPDWSTAIGAAGADCARAYGATATIAAIVRRPMTALDCIFPLTPSDRFDVEGGRLRLGRLERSDHRAVDDSAVFAGAVHVAVVVCSGIGRSRLRQRELNDLARSHGTAALQSERHDRAAGVRPGYAGGGDAPAARTDAPASDAHLVSPHPRSELHHRAAALPSVRRADHRPVHTLPRPGHQAQRRRDLQPR